MTKSAIPVLSLVLLTAGTQVTRPPVPIPTIAPDASLVIPQTLLNGLVSRLGAISDSGFYQPTQMMAAASLQNCKPFGVLGCTATKGHGTPLLLCDTPTGGVALAVSAPAATWQWWIVNPHFTVTTGALSFAATLHEVVAGQTNDVTNTASGGVEFDAAANALRIKIAALQVPLEYQGATITVVDIAKLYSLSIPIEPQQFSIPMPDGSTKTVTAKAESVSAHYEPNAIRVDVKLGF